MNIYIETNRLILRKLEYSDKDDLFEMDADPDVHLFIENNPVNSIDEEGSTLRFRLNNLFNQL